MAKLARIGLAEEEKEKFGKDLSSILDYVSKLNELNTKDIEPTLGGGETESNTGRLDIVLDCLPEVRQKLLENMPAREGDLLKTKAVFEEPAEDF